MIPLPKPGVAVATLVEGGSYHRSRRSFAARDEGEPALDEKSEIVVAFSIFRVHHGTVCPFHSN